MLRTDRFWDIGHLDMGFPILLIQVQLTLFLYVENINNEVNDLQFGSTNGVELIKVHLLVKVAKRRVNKENLIGEDISSCFLAFMSLCQHRY